MEKDYVDKVYESVEFPVGYAADYMLIDGMTIPAAVFLSQVVYWSRRDFVKKRGGWFHKQQKGVKDSWKNETGLTPKQQMNARKILRYIGVIEEDKSGIPAKTWFRLDGKRLHELLNEGRQRRDKISAGGQETSGFGANGESVFDQFSVPSVTNKSSRRSGLVKPITETTTQIFPESKRAIVSCEQSHGVSCYSTPKELGEFFGDQRAKKMVDQFGSSLTGEMAILNLKKAISGVS
ncbi:hypothetical protein RSO68_12515 [Halomonas saccharevitans]|uniref:Uncharacterized protein n=1 Tax=Halomonas saccharevitans TaxID=416872 RepID=A0ABU3NGK0_9GAMM|nr:hypothetical protein [Halomonas saccharevitans]MDT8880294.1 hypothetical protein [Halomonas saccharevitans]